MSLKTTEKRPIDQPALAIPQTLRLAEISSARYNSWIEVYETKNVRISKYAT